MRHVFLVFLVLAGGLGGRAVAAPFEPATVPDQVDAVGHLDVDALRRTQLFAGVGGQAAVDAAFEKAPQEFRPLARSLSRSVRGVSFWKQGDHGAVYVATGDTKGLGQLIAKLPVKPAPAIDGFPVYAMDGGDKQGYCAVYGTTLVMADGTESLTRSLRVLGGKAANLGGSTRISAAARRGVFVFVTLGDDALGAIQKSAHSKVLQLGLKALVVDIGETGGVVTASARAEMSSADTLQKAKSILEGLRAMASLSDDAPAVRKLLDSVTVSTSGLTLEIASKLPASELAKLIQAAGRDHK
ncbi:MAG: hypothetical protein H7138_09360 [Myxococcales bacterium]|nr:hypothetical protein [Myxococcales bacterium]